MVDMGVCLMTMIEVAYQLREHALVLVGSEAVESGRAGRMRRFSAI